MKKRQNAMIFLALILVLLMPTLILLAYGQQTSASNGQQTSASNGQPSVIVVPQSPPNPQGQPSVIVVPQSPPNIQGGPNATNQQPQNPQGGSNVTDPVVLAIAFVGAAAGVIYRTIYPYLERLQELEAKGEETVKFLTKYKFTFGISLLISLVTTIGLFSGLLPQLDINAGLGMIFISSFVQGIGWNELTNRVSYKIADRTVEKEAAKKKQPSMISMAKEIIGVKGGGQAEAPKIVGKYPIQGLTNISVSSPIAATFSKQIDNSTITKDTFTLRKDGSNVNIDAEEIKVEENGQTVIFKPKGDLEKNTKYIVTVTKEVKDPAGNKMISDETWSFNTAV
jgi:hypothetical protein